MVYGERITVISMEMTNKAGTTRCGDRFMHVYEN